MSWIRKKMNVHFKKKYNKMRKLVLGIFMISSVVGATFMSCVRDNDTPCNDCDKSRITILYEDSNGNISRTAPQCGYATGEGIFDRNSMVNVSAYPASGYEVEYFYGGPSCNERQYDYSISSERKFTINTEQGNHVFHLKFKKGY